MNKTDLVKSVALRAGCAEVTARQMVDILLEVVQEELSNGNEIVLRGFGTFKPWAQSLREGRNPRTGESCAIPPRMSVKFKVGTDLLKVMNKVK